MNDLIARDLPGYAIGGLSGGEAKVFYMNLHLIGLVLENSPFMHKPFTIKQT
jgi:hypothetical protein